LLVRCILLRQRPANTSPSTLGVDDQGPNDGSGLFKVGCLRAVRWYVGNCTYDVASNFGDDNLPSLCQVRHALLHSLAPTGATSDRPAPLQDIKRVRSATD
jgi:hypothetical protein